ncbi:MAG: hypothetical protein GXX84_15580 [Acidobacteria bacterium]|nr:hypothetical protein [Acidobacteriota bacterium]
MFRPVEEEDRIFAEQQILRAGAAANVSLCQYKEFSCVRCCLPHIGGDVAMDARGYLGPGGVVMKFTNFNPLMGPRIEASQYEDAFPDVGREEMERRFSRRRELFLRIYDRRQPAQSLARYMKTVQAVEGYRYRHSAVAGPFSLYIGGSVGSVCGLPECHLLAFLDREGRVGCMAHPQAETSQGYDGRDEAGFFSHTGCCRNVGCEACREFGLLSRAAFKVFDKGVAGMTWYEYSRHSTSVFVYYLRSYDQVLQKCEERGLLDKLTMQQLVAFTNTLYDDWPLRNQECADPVAILSTDIPLSERILYIALATRFRRGDFAVQLQNARARIEKRIDDLSAEVSC